MPGTILSFYEVCTGSVAIINHAIKTVNKQAQGKIRKLEVVLGIKGVALYYIIKMVHLPFCDGIKHMCSMLGNILKCIAKQSC